MLSRQKEALNISPFFRVRNLEVSVFLISRDYKCTGQLDRITLGAFLMQGE